MNVDEYVDLFILPTWIPQLTVSLDMANTDCKGQKNDRVFAFPHLHNRCSLLGLSELPSLGGGSSLFPQKL
jgi:hypothetical protein